MTKKDWVKLDIRDIYKLGKCGSGYHIRLSKKIVESFGIKPHDRIRVHLVEWQTETYDE